MDSSLTIADVPGSGAGEQPTSIRINPACEAGDLAPQLAQAVERTQQWLMSQQHADGYWVAELEGDTILESEYMMLLAFLGRHRTPVALKAAQYIANRQLPQGGWSLYPGGRIDISGSVKAYFALKLAGHDINSEYMRRARTAIRAAGGADMVNSFTRFYLALLGQISYEQCPAVPPEVMLSPRWFPINLYSVSAWTRTMVVPLSIMSACQPVAQLDPSLGIRELFLKEPSEWPQIRCPGLKGGRGLFSWDRFFRVVDAGLRFCQRHKILPLRRRALAAAKEWMIEHFAGSDGMGAIYPPMLWSIIALRALGYSDDTPELKYCYERLDGLIIEENDTVRLQPCKSPVWDTAITLRALASGGVPAEEKSVAAAVRWLLDQQIHRKGDWAHTTDATPGGWCFEHANEFYPDLDDTAMVLMALAEQFAAQPTAQVVSEETTETTSADAGPASGAKANEILERTARAIHRGEQWVLAMQNRDGGWGAFDRDNDNEFLCYVPFADHNAMIDPSSPDLTARVLESLGQLGRRLGDPAVDRAVAYLRATQEADGCWFGRWGVNYIYGTWQALIGLQAVGVSPDDPTIVRGAQWLLACQQPSGGWGESPDSYAEPALRGQGPITPSQTAWAVLGLMSAGLANHPGTLRGLNYLLQTQRADGTWEEAEYTGTGFPQVFYLRYHWYPIYFPLMALSRWAASAGADVTADNESLDTSAVA